MNSNWFWSFLFPILATPSVVGALGVWIGAALRKAAKSVSDDNTLKMIEAFVTNVATSFTKNDSAASIKSEVWQKAQTRIPETIKTLGISPETLATKVVEKVQLQADAAVPVKVEPIVKVMAPAPLTLGPVYPNTAGKMGMGSVDYPNPKTAPAKRPYRKGK